MTARALVWPAGLAASALANAAALAGLAALLAPDPVPQQQKPETRIDVEAYALDRSEAVPAAADPESAARSDAGGTALSAGAIARTRARAGTPAAAPATGLAAAGAALVPAAMPGQALPESPTGAARTPTVQGPVTALVPAGPDTDRARPATAPPQALAAAETPGASVIAATPAFTGLSASAPERPRLPDSAPLTSPAADLPPPALPVRTDVPAPSVIDPQRPAFALALAADTAPQGLPTLAPETAGLTQSDLPAQPLDTARPETETARAAGPTGQPAIAAPVRPETAASAQPARAEAQSATPSVARAAAARGQADTLLAGTAAADAAPAVAPRARPAASARPPADVLPPGPAQAAAAPVAQAQADPATSPVPVTDDARPARLAAADLQPAAPDATAITAALAFSGGDGDIDPLSVVAFQSFVAPDATRGSEQLRDGLAGLLAAVPCSRLQLAFDPDTAALRVDGHIPDDSLRAGVLSALQSELGADIAVSDNMRLLPRPQCGALAAMSDIDLPQSTDQATNPLLLGETLQARVLDFVAGELIYFDLTAPDYDAFVYVDYFDADGNVLHISPNDGMPLIFAPAETTFRVGAASPDETDALRLFVQAPFGQEIAVAFAASVPLYDRSRPLVEPAAPYLDWLRRRVAAARAENPDFKGEWVYFFVTTAPG